MDSKANPGGQDPVAGILCAGSVALLAMMASEALPGWQGQPALMVSLEAVGFLDLVAPEATLDYLADLILRATPASGGRRNRVYSGTQVQTRRLPRFRWRSSPFQMITILWH